MKRKAAAGLVGVKSSSLDRRSLRQRFRAALSSACVLLPRSATNLSDAIEAVILDRSPNITELDLRTLNAIAIGLWQHQDLNAMSRYLPHLEDQLVALLIALACRDALSPKTAIAKIDDFLSDRFRWSSDRQDEIASLSQQFNLVRTLVEQGASGTIAQSALISPSQDNYSSKNHIDIAYGLYCWLSTPYSWQLAVSRAQQIQPELGVAIGAIAAAYSGNLPPGDIDILETGIILGDRLLAAWAGVVNWQQLDPDFYATITAPDILGKREGRGV
jgi:hypothetical protein